MTAYRRAYSPGATWFFTVALAERRGNRLLVERVDALRSAFRDVQTHHPFRVDAIVILPEHLHCLWTLPPGDTDFSTRWSLIKSRFSRSVPSGERLSASRAKRGEAGRAGHLAAAFLGASDSQRRRFFPPRRLHPLESGQA